MHVTHDGGHTWRPETAPWAAGFYRLSAIDGVVWVVHVLSDQVFMYRSSDEGLTWTRSLVPITISTHEEERWNLRFNALAHQAVWLLTSTGFWMTTDAGITWHAQRLPQTGLFYHDLQQMDDDTLWLEGYCCGGAGMKYAQLYRSRDQGQTWIPMLPVTPSPDALIRRGMCFMAWSQWYMFVDGDTVLGYSDEVALAKSDDGGYSWHNIVSFTESLTATSIVQIVDQHHWWVVGYQQDPSEHDRSLVVLRTRDGGASWERIVIQ